MADVRYEVGPFRVDPARRRLLQRRRAGGRDAESIRVAAGLPGASRHAALQGRLDSDPLAGRGRGGQQPHTLHRQAAPGARRRHPRAPLHRHGARAGIPFCGRRASDRRGRRWRRARHTASRYADRAGASVPIARAAVENPPRGLGGRLSRVQRPGRDYQLAVRARIAHRPIVGGSGAVRQRSARSGGDCDGGGRRCGSPRYVAAWRGRGSHQRTTPARAGRYRAVVGVRAGASRRCLSAPGLAHPPHRRCAGGAIDGAGSSAAPA